MQEQSSLGQSKAYVSPDYNQTQIGKVVSTANYDKYGKVDVVFLDYSKPFPVWVNGELDRKPVEGDLVLVGFIQARQDSPYLAGFIRNESYTANFIQVEKDRITIQLPTSLDDVKGHLLDGSKKASRKYVELNAGGIYVHADNVVLADGTKAVARQGDTVAVTNTDIGNCSGSGSVTGTVSVNVPGVGDCAGTITSGSATVTTYVGHNSGTGTITSGNSKVKA